jgi:hypothetical protein
VELLWTFLISLTPMLAMLPLALAAVAIVALLVIRPLRQALGAWATHRFRVSAPPAVDAAEVRALRDAVVAAEQRAVEAQASVAALERRLNAAALTPPDGIRAVGARDET